MELDQMHLFSDERVHVAYDPEGMCFYRLADQVWVESQSARPSGDISSMTEAAPDRRKPDVESQMASHLSGFEENQALERLVLIITTNCNLRCRYCYAEGGAYGMTLQNMSPELARRAVDWVLKIVPAIGAVQFFGGEPALNHRIIETVCETFAQHHSSNHIERLPQYAMVTNGTLLPAKLEELIQRYQIYLTYSIDGPSEVHNVNRLYVNGQGSFHPALSHFKRLRNRGDVGLGVEMTFTPVALDAGYDVWKLAQFSQAELGLPEPHVVPVSSEPGSVIGWNSRSEEAITSYRTAAAASLQSLLNGQYVGFSFLSGILRCLITKRARPLICPAGASTLAIDPSGDIYPCFMFAGQPELRMGNVNTPPDQVVFVNRLQTFIHDNRKDTHAACRTCWARKLCTGCVGDIQLSTGTLYRESPLLCDLMKAIAEETMLFLAKIQADAETWKRFVTNYRAFRLDQVDPVKDII